MRVDSVEGEIGVGGGERVFVRMLAVAERAVRGVASTAMSMTLEHPWKGPTIATCFVEGSSR